MGDSDDEDHLLEIFRKFDVNKDGVIDRSELTGLLAVLDPDVFDDETVRRLVKHFDTDKDGMLSYEEFLPWLKAGGEHVDTLLQDLQPSDLPRWMLHRRPDDRGLTSLRAGPGRMTRQLRESVLRDEVVEVIAGPVNSYVLVRLALTGAQGWIYEEHLHECPEGTSEHGRLSSEDESGSREVCKIELDRSDRRFMEVRDFLREASGGKLGAEQVWFITGHFLGETAMRNGPKEVLFHGTSEEAVDSIVETGFDDKYSCDGKFGTGLYFSPEPMTSYGYGHELFLCEVALGTPEQRVVATECCSDYTWQGLLREGMRSVECHGDVFGQEERIVYHCTQCKPVYCIKVRYGPPVLPRWMEHQRTDSIPKSSLRKRPTERKDFVDGTVLNGEIVEVLDRSGPCPSESGKEYVLVRLALTRIEGWLDSRYLQPCPEGTRDHGRLAGDGRDVELEQIHPRSRRGKELQRMITQSQCSNANCHCAGIDIEIKQLWFIKGQYLGETGMVTGPKESLFHGCSDEVVQLIAKNGFDNSFSTGGAFGQGLYFSPQSCKAFSYAENHLLVCEVALGTESNRLTLAEPDRDMDVKKVFRLGKRSVQCHAGAPFNHEERIVYLPTQCKPVYIIETTVTSPGGGV